MVELSLAHSPDSDDMVMWWPLTGIQGPSGVAVDGPEGRPAIDTGQFTFRTVADDVQRLNRRAIDIGDFDITAVSAHTYPHIRSRYAITSCGASMGEGYGPKLVVRNASYATTLPDLLRDLPENDGAVAGGAIAIPGRQTTAYLTLRLLAGRPFPIREMLFSEIPGAVSRGEVVAGLLIHEAQLSFASLGLRPLVDVGEAWFGRTGLPLPLGLNVIRRDLDSRFGQGTVARVAQLLSASVRFAVAHPVASRRMLLLHSGDRPEWRDDELVRRYLAMYVSPLTMDMGERGRTALATLLGEGFRAGLCPDPGEIDLAG